MYRLLLAEDEFIEKEAMKHIIGHKFPDTFEIQEASNGLEAIELARSFKPHIIFLDIKMPGCSGLEAAATIRRELPEVSMIFITAYDYFDYAKEAISLGVDAFLLKPVDIDEVCAYLEQKLEKLEESAKSHTQNKQLEQEFKLIKKKYEAEFKEALLDYHVSEDRLKQYFDMMDIQMKEAVIGLVDFANLTAEGNMASVQKEVIRERFKSKLEIGCEARNVWPIIGELKEIVTIVFIGEKSQEDLKAELAGMLEGCIQMMGLPITYQLSRVITRLGDLPKVLYEEKQQLFKVRDKERCVYPYVLEDQIIEAIRKKDFVLARACTLKLMEELMEGSEYSDFESELKGLYVVIERAFIRGSSELFLPDASHLVGEIRTYHGLINFYNRLFEYAVEVLEQLPDKNKALIQKFCQYLETHYDEDLSLEEAAGMIGFSSFYFTKLMKEHVNMSYIDYVTKVRVEKAKQYLETSALSVKDVGTKVGYDNANYFTRVFKRMEGITPSQYKSKYHEGKIKL